MTGSRKFLRLIQEEKYDEASTLAYEKLGDWKNAAMYYKKSIDMHKTSARVRAYERVMNELTSKAR